MNSENILDTPNAVVSVAKKWNSKAQIGVGTFLGGPIAATFFIAENYKNLGDKSTYQKTLIYGTLATIALFAALFLIPETSKIPSQVFPIAYLVSVNAYIQQFQLPLILAHTAAGGKQNSWLRTVGISILFLLITVLIIGAVMYLMGDFNVEQ
jgi:hypothetical protein